MIQTQSNIYYATFPEKTACFIISVILKLWYLTLRFKVSKTDSEALRRKEKLVGITWHNRVFLTPMLKLYFRRKLPMCGLVSSSRDGAWLAALFGFFGVKCARGSTTRHGARAMVEMIRIMRNENSSVFITPDGPQGPRYKAKSGALAVARGAESRIMLLKLTPRRYFSLKTWDKFMIPLPFSTIDLECAEFHSYEDMENSAKEKGLSAAELIDQFLGSNP